jgi:hypothetical protein
MPKSIVLELVLVLDILRAEVQPRGSIDRRFSGLLNAFGRQLSKTDYEDEDDKKHHAYDPDAVNPSSARRAFRSFDTRLS